MKTAWHGILIAGYAVFAFVIAVILPMVTRGMAPGMGVMAGLVVFVCCGLIHEIYTRRRSDAQTVRRLLTLKKAYDQQKQELDAALAEIRHFQASGSNPQHRGEARVERPPPGAAPQRPIMPDPRSETSYQPEREFSFSAERERPSPRQGRPISPLMQERAKEEEEETLFPEQRAPTLQAEETVGSTKELREMEAEVKVLHSLVEQLYNDDGRYGKKSTSPEKPDTAKKKPKRRGLRIVGQKDDEPILDIVREGLRHDRIDLYLQPIVSLPQRKRRFFECFSRIRAADGAVIKPEEYLPVAKKEGLETAIDNMLLFRSVQLLRKVRAHDYSMAFFCNISPNSLSDESFLQDFITYMENHQDLAPSLIMELNQADIPKKLDDLSPQMDRLGNLGYRFALDGVTDFDLDFKNLQSHHFQFVKVNAKALIERFKESPTGGEIRSFKQQLDDKGIDMIVEQIETEQMLIELLDFNIDYGQGFLFGEPRISKDPTTGMRAI